MSPRKHQPLRIRTLRLEDTDRINAILRKLYPNEPLWLREHFESHLRVFPEGQLVAADPETDQVLGYAASLIIRWEDYEFDHSWDEFTDRGYFTNHDPRDGRTLYGADIMVDPDVQGRGVGSAIYQARFDLCRSLNLMRIRAGARLRGYHRHAEQLSPEQYVVKVVNRELHDPTLSFQLKRGFRVIAVVEGYLHKDPESLGNAAVIEWINHAVTPRVAYRHRDPKFARKRRRISEQD